MAISLLRMPFISSARSGTRSRPCQRIWPATMRPGGIGISFSTDIAVTVLPQPDSPTTPTRLAAVDSEVDAVHGLHHAVVGGEVGLEAADLEQRARAITSPCGDRARRAGRRR